MPRSRRSNFSQRSLNTIIRLRNITNQSTEADREIALKECRFSMAKLRASQIQNQRETAFEMTQLEMRNRRTYHTDQLSD
ncbi:unnamed protein product [Euphydryas editha]|uniref:Uncharacterized protein n=1 Tax=Euphydryas editha TaxID=104508 RepID=A0AAU9V226_EUPED|nr:unnamed protein product [Euphydryas editha]